MEVFVAGLPEVVQLALEQLIMKSSFSLGLMDWALPWKGARIVSRVMAMMAWKRVGFIW